MASMDFDAEYFEKRLTNLKDSQDSIQSLSTWCLERRPHHKKIVASWLQVLKKVKVEHRLTLFYLANDVIQYSKRKNFEFVESWGTTLQRATTMVRDEKVKHRILRIFKIWDQRQVYDEEFLADLSGLISAAPKKKAEPQPIVVPEEFQAALLISTMRSCATLEQATDARLKDLRDSNVDIDNAEELCASLKDRRHVEDAEKEVEVAVSSVESYVRALEAEIRERTQVLELLEQADQFYETQRGEVKIVANAYRNFGSRVKNLKKKLDELLPTLTSPIPSPDVNAPSPSPDSDIELPGDELNASSNIIDVTPAPMYGSYVQDYDVGAIPPPDLTQGNSSTDFTSNFSSFMGGNVDFDMRNIFNDRSLTPTGSNHSYNIPTEAMPIEVINMRPKDGNEFTPSFLKSVLPSSEAPSGIPGLGLDIPEPPPESPQRSEYPHLPGQLNNAARLSLGNQLRGLGNDSHTPSPYSSQGSQSNVAMVFENQNPVPINPLPPPPLPPPIFLDEENCYNKLPPKFPTWTSTNEAKNINTWTEEKPKSWEGSNNRWNEPEARWSNGMQSKPLASETSDSPPSYEKSNFHESIEYPDSQAPEPLVNSVTDVDHRVAPAPRPNDIHLPRLMKSGDVDHRNLISLTGSPASVINSESVTSNNRIWDSDQDYRRQVQSGDIVESVDMEMSDDEADGPSVKQKNRVLVDLRAQDRDMRITQPPPPPRHDMDMRMIPLPNNPMIRGPMPDMRNVHIRPPPPGQFHPQEFVPGQPNNFPRPEDFPGGNCPPGMPGFMPPGEFPPHPDYARQDIYESYQGPPPGDHQSQIFRGRGRGFRNRFSDHNDRNRRRHDDNLADRQQNLQPPDTVVILDDNGMPIMPDLNDGRLSLDPEEHEDLRPPGHSPDISEIPDKLNDDDVNAEERAQTADEAPRNLSEHLEALMNSNMTNDMERQNGLLEQDMSTAKRPINGPPSSGISDIHPGAFDYESPNANFRPRMPTNSPFAGPWRGNHTPRSRGGFRGSPRAPWNDRSSEPKNTAVGVPNFAPLASMIFRMFFFSFLSFLIFFG
ncbi:Similar to RPRD2: Regulation of nuclear pre-mRNA domain-containing protein 2 (Homo sapiens) [Cotesia congregata]|uniref:Regulation of nuclear pre-mRNA domain-containing protein 2 n=1 Tax=Cotesia congregata TaxID=51543 RepID=A0A8J2H936_COTCN|nr:Similar to RPRD2: Regulation of nuclear pre-mRNA domain-containing protein 2 (Homo sapiens) [Cotesia congregata]